VIIPQRGQWRAGMAHRRLYNGRADVYIAPQRADPARATAATNDLHEWENFE
jgi:hypothetical protein